MSRQITAWWTITALLFGALLPFFAVYDNDALAAYEPDEKVLICTADGFKWLSRAELSDENPPREHPQFQCALCYVSAYGGDKIQPLAGSVQVVYAPMPDNMPPAPPKDERARWLDIGSVENVRAPPFFFV